jgi:hypothetical protein
MERGTRRPHARTVGKMLGAGSLILLLLLVLAASRPGAVSTIRKPFDIAGWYLRVWSGKEQPCEWTHLGADCPITCTQANLCLALSDPDYAVCKCRSMLFAPCTTALDCPMGTDMPAEELWTCRHYPGSTVGSCERWGANCAVARDCEPIDDCSQGPICDLIIWGDNGVCKCAPKDGGVP